MSAKKTVLYDDHVALGAQMVEFAKSLLPVRFQSEKEEHMAVRKTVGLFDVSHMGEFSVKGHDAHDLLSMLLTNNLDRLTLNQAQYTLMLNEQGGIIDDVIVYRLLEKAYFLCVNAVNIEKDWGHLKDHATHFKEAVITNESDDYAQLALQGPNSAPLLRTLTKTSLPEKFFIKPMSLVNVDALVSRTGYTGEDGFEIFINQAYAHTLYQALIAHGKDFGLRLCGLSARDSLRIEAGMLLHGQDMDENTTPMHAGLMFAVDLDKSSFVGKTAVLAQKKRGVKNKLTGFQLLDKGLARRGFQVFDEHHQKIGVVTSATFLPTVEAAVGFAYISSDRRTLGRHVFIDIRGRMKEARLCPLRFIHH